MAMHGTQLLGIPVNPSGHPDYVKKGISAIYIPLAVGMPEVKERLWVLSE